MAAQSDSRRTNALLLAPPVAAAIMALTWSTGFVRELENVTIDWRFVARADTDPPPDPRIALVGIGEQSLEANGRWEDWTRRYHARFLDALQFRPPRVVAYDFFFTEPSADPEDDLQFAYSIENHPGTITGMFIDTSREAFLKQEKLREAGKDFPPVTLFATKPFPNVSGDTSGILSGPTALTPIETIAQSAWTASVNCPPSRTDGMRRRIPLIIKVQDQIYPSLVLQILMQWEEAHRDDVRIEMGEAITLPKSEGGEWRIPIDEGGFLYLNYRNTERFAINDYEKVREEIKRTVNEGIAWPDSLPEFTDQIVLIGQSAEGLSDFGPSPYLAQEPLFRVQATALDSILRDDYLKTIPLPAAIAGWLVIAWLTLLTLRNAPIWLAVIVPLLIIVIVSTLAFVLFRTHSLLIPLVLPVLGFLLIHATITGDRLAVELREKKYIRGVFGSYVSPEVVDQIITSGETPKLGGERVNITILFSDIQGFSTFSEQLEPEELVDLMVEYLSEMTDIVTDQGGTLDKYIGDAIDAMYGAPLPLPGHAYLGVMTAIEMQRMQAELRQRWQSQNKPDLVRMMRTRIGVNTGDAVVGNMGSHRRFNYTMMGDNVNLGARFESGAKSYGVYTMITGETRDAAIEIEDNIVYRFLDQIVVKGRSLPVKAYEVIETKGNVDKTTHECLHLYAAAMEKYFVMEWDAARELFEQASELEFFQPDRDAGVSTNPSRIMAARCGIMKVDPPEADWDGVYRMTTK